jgi:hypothetical protein
MACQILEWTHQSLSSIEEQHCNIYVCKLGSNLFILFISSHLCKISNHTLCLNILTTFLLYISKFLPNLGLVSSNNANVESTGSKIPAELLPNAIRASSNNSPWLLRGIRILIDEVGDSL